MDIAKELYFSPGVKFSEIKWENKDALIEAFKDRVKGFYLDPAKKLNAEKYAFATGVLCVSTIDLLACITISCNSGTVGTRFTQWIKDNLTAFDNSNPNSEILADKFYEEFRNGLVHEGRIKNVGQFSYDDKEELIHILKEMFLFSWDEITENDSDKFVEYLKQNYGISWAGKENIEKIDDNRISASYENKSLSLMLNDERTKVTLKIKGTEKFTEILSVKKESGNLNIYKVMILVNPNHLLEEVISAFEKYISKVKSDKSKFSELKTYLEKFKGEIEYANSC